jgi:beta-galactosidase/beta-glucuronidase
MTSSIPRPEHPRPQFERKDWINLNGTWTFTFDPGKSGHQRGLEESKGFDRDIQVPFCPESKLSGVQHVDFIERMWYHRVIEIPSSWDGRRVLLHFGGVDYACEVYIDGVLVERHWGGSAPFTYDITRFVKAGSKHHLVLQVRDDMQQRIQPLGKQSAHFKSHGCVYTRTTGIWQTVWLEAVSPFGLADCQILPDLDGKRFTLVPRYRQVKRGVTFRATLKDGGKTVSEVSVPATDGAALELMLANAKAWSPESPFLYDLTLEVLDGGKVVDSVASYAALRKVHIEGNQFFLNNKAIYLRFVLDQGFNADGIWTAPTDEALKRDIELSFEAGFNGARLHEKVFEDRFHYWADRLGYLTWAEFPNWGSDENTPLAARAFLMEWEEVMTHLRNHPSIVAWTPLNETWVRDEREYGRFVRDLYRICKTIDPTRPVNDSSGYVHWKTDIWTMHNYEQDPVKLKETAAPPKEIPSPRRETNKGTPYQGQPWIVDEFGGIKWIPEDRAPHSPDSFGYGDTPKTIEEFYARLEGQVKALVENKDIVGYCYTQLTDVEQEQNGVYNYDRTAKFDMKRIHAIFQTPRPSGD